MLSNNVKNIKIADFAGNKYTLCGFWHHIVQFVYHDASCSKDTEFMLKIYDQAKNELVDFYEMCFEKYGRLLRLNSYSEDYKQDSTWCSKLLGQ